MALEKTKTVFMIDHGNVDISTIVIVSIVLSCLWFPYGFIMSISSPVFIQPSITKGSAGRPLIDYFNWLVEEGVVVEERFVLISSEDI